MHLRSTVPFLIRLACLSMSLLLAACGGGASGSGSGVQVASPGVGSGGTGVSMGPITGFGSIVVNDVRHNIDGVSPFLEDADELKIGMMVRVTGSPITSDGASIATSVSSAAELRGAVGVVDAANGALQVLGVTVSTDSATVYGGLVSLSTLGAGQFVQVSGLPLGSGGLRATRIDQVTAPFELITTGPVTNLNPSAGTFKLGASTVNFNAAVLDGLLVADLADGLVVRVRGQLSGGVVAARKIQQWQAPVVDGTRSSLAGVVSDYNALSGTFKISDVAVNASAAVISGANANRLGNGVKVDVQGTFANGELQATQLKIRHVPGEGNLPSFSAEGRINPFVSPANFKVRGQRIDASQPGVVFINGAAASLGANVQVFITGSRVVDDVLIATQVRF